MFSLSHLHPMLVHFPIALVIFGFIALCASLIFKKEACLSISSFYLLLVGTLSAVVAWLTGILFTSDMTGAAGQIKEIHELAAFTTVGLLVITSLLSVFLKIKNKENSNLKLAVFVLYSLAALSVSVTGFLHSVFCLYYGI
jgi:uncharacterized membrane protein